VSDSNIFHQQPIKTHFPFIIFHLSFAIESTGAAFNKSVPFVSLMTNEKCQMTNDK
jgi:hypothetical protein